MYTAAQQYSRGAADRESYLRRARDSSRLTVPALVPPRWLGPQSDLLTPYQGLGAQGVNNLASKLLLSLFPPTQPFFRLVPTDPEALRSAPEKIQTEVEEGLSAMEKAISSEMEVLALRVKLFEALKHLLVAGNVVLHVQPEGDSRVMSLEQYVCRRDAMGWLECLITMELLDRENLPPAVAAIISKTSPRGGLDNPIPVSSIPPYEAQRSSRGRQDSVSLYTCIEWDAEEGVYTLFQEVEGRRIPGMRGRYKPELLPYRVLRYAAIDGEDYGRGMVEEILGDLVSLEGLMRAIVEGAAISSRCIGLVNPSGAATADDLNKARNGDYIVGRHDDVTYPPINKAGDLQVAFSAVQMITERLSRAFLLNSAVQRQAERVTAEEVRYVAQELESALGGVFSVLSQELQLPLVALVMHQLTKTGKIRKLPANTVRPAIVTGIEALGRGQDLARLQLALQASVAAVGADQLSQYMNVRNVLGQIFAAAGVDTSETLRSEEEVQQSRQEAQMMDMLHRVGPNVVNQAGPGVAQALGLPSAPEGGAPPESPPATPAR